MKQSTVDDVGPSQPSNKPKKRTWYMRAIEKILCMNVAIHKENYGAYKSRHAILTNQVKIRTALKVTPPKTPAALVDYTEWHSKKVSWTEDVSSHESDEEDGDGEEETDGNTDA